MVSSGIHTYMRLAVIHWWHTGREEGGGGGGWLSYALMMGQQVEYQEEGHT